MTDAANDVAMTIDENNRQGDVGSAPGQTVDEHAAAAKGDDESMQIEGGEGRSRGRGRRSGKDRRDDGASPNRRHSDRRGSVFDRLGQTNRDRERGFKREGRAGKNMGRDIPRRDGRRDFQGRGPPPLPPMRRGPPPLPRGPPPGPCQVSKRDDGVVVARAFDADIIQVSGTGEVCLCRPTGPDGVLRCDAEVLHAFNSCLNKFGFKVSAAPTDETAWSLSDGKRLSRFHDGIVVPPPNPPGPGRGLAMMLTTPVGAGGGARGGGRGHRGGRRMW